MSNDRARIFNLPEGAPESAAYARFKLGRPIDQFSVELSDGSTRPMTNQELHDMGVRVFTLDGMRNLHGAS